MSLFKDNIKKHAANIVVDAECIAMTAEAIRRSTERLEKLITLEAPMPIIKREVEMIQYNALDILSCYEALALLKFAYKEQEESNG